jgi:hypothetical protein
MTQHDKGEKNNPSQQWRVMIGLIADKKREPHFSQTIFDS